jgi:hypothetical protein
MEFLFALFNEEKRWDGMTPDEFRREVGAYMAYSQALREAGVYVDGNPLEPTSTAATVRVERDGQTTVLDGPYADTKEQLGGYYVVNVPDRDSALAWAARCPCASHGTVEVRALRAVPAIV